MPVRILYGDCVDVLRALPDASVHCCVTSPPYFGLRDYDVPPTDWPEVTFVPMAGLPAMTIPAMTCCHGLEPEPWSFIAHEVHLFREVHRVLRDDGTLWLNIGDSYAGSWGAQGRQGKTGQMASRSIISARQIGAHPKRLTGTGSTKHLDGIKSKDLIGIPWMLAFALRADGAESPSHMLVVERLIAAIENSYDNRDQWPDRIAAEVERLEREHADANRGGWYLRQDIIWSKPNPMPESVGDRCTKAHEYLFLLTKSPRYYFNAEAIAEPLAAASVARLAQDVESQAGSNRVPGKTNGPMKAVGRASGAKQIGTAESHRMGREPGWRNRPQPTVRNKRSVWNIATQPFKEAHYATFPPALVEPCILAGCPDGGTVLDPFGGAGTTGLVADRLQRAAILIELNPGNVEMSRKRIAADAPLFVNVGNDAPASLVSGASTCRSTRKVAV